jgi:hypothetical protein
MTAFLLGVVLSSVPGLITGWIGWSALGALMHRDNYCRHHPILEQMGAEASVPAVAERVRLERPAVANVTHLSQVEIPQVPELARPQVVVMPVFMPLTGPPLQALPQWPPQTSIALKIPELESSSSYMNHKFELQSHISK